MLGGLSLDLVYTYSPATICVNIYLDLMFSERGFVCILAGVGHLPYHLDPINTIFLIAKRA